MELREVIRRRRMVRNYSPEPIPREVLERVLEAARRAPSAGNAQGTELLVLAGSENTERFWECTFEPGARAEFSWPGLFRAPVIVIPIANAGAYLARYSEGDKVASGLGHDTSPWPVPYWLTDAAMAVQLMLLAAVDEGLGALFFGIFRGEDLLRSELGIPTDRELVGAVTLGWPAPGRPSTSSLRPRRSLSEIVHWGRFGASADQVR